MPALPCPVAGCRGWTTTRRGKWYSLPSNFTLKIDGALLLLHDKVCSKCWHRHDDHSIELGGRIRAFEVSLMDELLVAAASPSLPPQSDTSILLSLSLLPPSDSPPSPRPPAPSSPQPTDTLSTLSHSTPVLSSSSCTPDCIVQRRVSVPLTPSPSKRLQTRRKWKLWQKRRICEEWSRAVSQMDKMEIKLRWRAEQIDGHQIGRWREDVKCNDNLPRGAKAPKQARRLRGAGGKTDLTETQEVFVHQWVMDQRRQLLAVWVTDIQLYAQSNFPLCQDAVTPFTAGWKWAVGFMRRHRLSMRLATTNKHVTTPDMRRMQFHFRNKLAAEFHSTDPLLLYNMDETSVTLDAPSSRTVDRKGAKCIEIGTTGHQFDRVAVVICVSRGGEIVTPLVIRRGTTKQYSGKFVRETHSGVDMFVTERHKAWLDSVAMVHWLELVYLPFVRDNQRQSVDRTHLFMDNCSVHDSELATAATAKWGIPHTFFPPHCTPILQPCDQNVNHIFKAQYERQWRLWMEREGCKEMNVTRYGNPAAAGKDTYMAWIGTALRCIDTKVINDSWQMSCAGYSRTVFQLPSTLWTRVLAFIRPEWADELSHVLRCRKLYTAWQTFPFPVTVRKRQKTPIVVTTSTPTKRRKATAGDSDADTDTEMEANNSEDKENQPPQSTAARDELREKRYQVLQAEQQESGSIRVLDKRVTSALWEARLRQPLRSLHFNAVN